MIIFMCNQYIFEFFLVSLPFRIFFITKFKQVQWQIHDFLLGGGGADPLGGGPPMCTLFGKNVCKNKRNGSCWGARAGGAPPGSAYEVTKSNLAAVNIIFYL